MTSPPPAGISSRAGILTVMSFSPGSTITVSAIMPAKPRPARKASTRNRRIRVGMKSPRDSGTLSRLSMARSRAWRGSLLAGLTLPSPTLQPRQPWGRRDDRRRTAQRCAYRRAVGPAGRPSTCAGGDDGFWAMTVGRRLAARLGRHFVDSDEEVEKAAGMSIEDIFATRGESDFRAGEVRVIARLLKEAGSGPRDRRRRLHECRHACPHQGVGGLGVAQGGSGRASRACNAAPTVLFCAHPTRARRCRT